MRKFPRSPMRSETIRPGYFLLQPGTRIVLKTDDAMLLEEHNGMLGFVDLKQNRVFHLSYPTYQAGIELMDRWPPNAMGIYRDAMDEAIGFFLWRGGTYAATFADDILPYGKIPEWALIFATPTTLQTRQSLTAPWIPVLGHHPKIKINQ